MAATMKRGYNKDTNLYPRGNASPLARVDANGMIDGKLVYPAWWDRFSEALLDGVGLHKAAQRVGTTKDTVLRWRRKCPHLEEEITVIREVGRQDRYERVREAQLKHRERLERMGQTLGARMASGEDITQDINAIRATDVITRGLDTERRAAEPRGESPAVVIQNNQTIQGDDPGVRQVYTDAEDAEIMKILKAANGEPAVIEGEIVE